MSPNLTPGRIVLGWNIGKPKVGELIIFRHQGLDKIKRVSSIENDAFYVLGDNPDESTDSRSFGYIERGQVVARVVWPLHLKS
jgi:type IV secretory pathway protease TraF